MKKTFKNYLKEYIKPGPYLILFIWIILLWSLIDGLIYTAFSVSDNIYKILVIIPGMVTVLLSTIYIISSFFYFFTLRKIRNLQDIILLAFFNDAETMFLWKNPDQLVKAGFVEMLIDMEKKYIDKLEEAKGIKAFISIKRQFNAEFNYKKEYYPADWTKIMNYQQKQEDGNKEKERTGTF